MDRAAFEAKLANCARFSAVPLPPGAPAAFRDLIDGLEAAPDAAALSAILTGVDPLPTMRKLAT